MTQPAIVRECAHCGQKNRIPIKRLTDTGKCGACKASLPPAAHPIEADAATFEVLLRDAPAPLLVDFWAPWCGPCRTMAPELEKLAKARAGSLIVAKVDTDQFPELARRFSIEALPTVVLFRDSLPVQRLSGARSAAALLRDLSL